MSASATNYYVSPAGDDFSPGTLASPFATIMRAQAAASSRDTVYLRGGTYFLNNSHLTWTNNPWAIVNYMDKSGISYLAYPGERPVFDFSNVRPEGYRVTAFLITSDANDCVFKGFDVVGVQITIAGTHTQSECFRVDGGSRNRFELLRLHDGMGNGWYLTDGADNLVLNCDAYNNRGLDGGSIGNIDGFGVHPSHTSGTGNVVRGCRAWFNSDDGYDCINAKAAVTFENCWAFYNGYWTNFVNLGGDGNGFKAGGYGLNGRTPPNPVPRHSVKFCLAVRNRVNGFYANHHTGGLDWINNTAYRNNVNYNMRCTLLDNLTDVDGYDQYMKNNLGYLGGSEVVRLGSTNENDVTFNYFTLPVSVSAADFASLDEALLTQPRQPDGDLPIIAFSRLTGTSDLRDQGLNIGWPFEGVAPDLGAFEYGPSDIPGFDSIVARGDGSFRLNLSGVNGQGYELQATTKPALPDSLWEVLDTDHFGVLPVVYDDVAATNYPTRFYRLRVP